MTIDIVMPAFSPTMEAGTVARWLFNVGDRVVAGTVVAEIETDKATMELECVAAGVIAELVVPAGTDDVPVGTTIARVDPEGGVETPEHTQTTAAADERPAVPKDPPKSRADGVARPRPELIGDTDKASPLARRLATVLAIDLDTLVGTGADGRISKDNVLGLKSTPSRDPRNAQQARQPGHVSRTTVRSIGPSQRGPEHAVRHDEPIDTPPLFIERPIHRYDISVHCNLDALLDLRTELNDRLAASGATLSVGDLLLKTLASTLKIVPEANVHMDGDVADRRDRVDVAIMAVTPLGIVFPVLRNVDTHGLTRVAVESRELAARARDGALRSDEWTNATVTMIDLGQFAVSEVAAGIYSRTAVSVSVAAGERRPMVVGDAITPATILTIIGSFDPRGIDAAVGARTMATLRALIEAPLAALA